MKSEETFMTGSIFHMTAFSSVSIDVLKGAVMTRQDTIYRKLSELAVGVSLHSGGYGRLPRNLVGGIVGVSDYGDRYPELYLASEGRIRPTQFGSSVLNSAVGHCSIVFNLRGPQFQLPANNGAFEYALRLAKQQIAAERAKLMVVLIFDDEQRKAQACVLTSSDMLRSAR